MTFLKSVKSPCVCFLGEPINSVIRTSILEKNSKKFIYKFLKYNNRINVKKY